MNDLEAEQDGIQNKRLPKPRRRNLWIAAAVLLLIAIGAGYALLTGTFSSSTSETPPPPTLSVTAVSPTRVMWPITLDAQGPIAPWQEASIGTQIGSYQLIEVLVNVGDQVKRGQVLARLNPALLKAEETQLLARYEQATANSLRAQQLQAAGGISDQDELQYTTEARTAASLLAAKRLELRYTSIVAPDEGVISARTATLGAVVPAGEELFRMIRKNRLEWRGELTAEQLKSVENGQSVALTLPDGSGARAVIRQTAPSLATDTRLAILYADLLPGSRARAGMYAKGQIAVGEAPALTVPAECVVIHDGRSYVAQIVGTRATQKVALREIATGRRQGDATEVRRGLSGSERLVRRGGAFLNDGDIVRVVDDPRASR